MKPVSCLAGLLTVLTAAQAAQTYDLVLRHGRVVDGTGNPAFFADVAVQHGRIAAIGRLGSDITANTEIDATDLIVAPGFIDVHTHADGVANSPEAQNFLHMGVTTVVVGNCGDSRIDIGEFFRQIEQKHISINAATLIGHNSIREEAMGGDFDRNPTESEMAAMKELVRRGMSDGAVGLSTGLIYMPGVFSRREEIVELARVVSGFDGIYTSHMRHEDSRIFSALDELFEIARQARVRAEVSHIKLSGERAWGQAEKVLAAIETARAQGLDVTQDMYVYTAASTGLRQTIPDWAFEGPTNKFDQVLSEPAQKTKLIREMKNSLQARGRTDYAYAVIASCPADKSLNGLNIVQASRKLRGGESLDEQIETILEIERQGPADAVFHGINEDDLRIFLRHSNTMIASDSSLPKLGVGVPHPRGYGNNARVLGRYVRELHLLRLEDAIRKMTSLPASTFHLEDRGQVRVGFWADLVAFDPQQVTDPATFEDPHHYARGIPHVLVNGVPVILDNHYTGARAGLGLKNHGR